MWESLFKSPRGRISSRKIFAFVTTVLVTSFAYVFAAPAPAFAAPATWEGDTLTYDGRTYSGPIDRADTKGLGSIDADAQIYQALESIAGTPSQTAHLIIFPGGVAPMSAKEARYVRYTLNPPNSYSSPTGRAKIEVEAAPDPAVDTSENLSECTVGEIGYVVCPVMKGISEVVDGVYSVVEGYLVVQPLKNDPNSAIYRAWKVMRDFANIAFAIGFLVIIYSYLTNVGVSNYEIKKIIPKLVLVAIMVNVSFYISAFAVDISNILGSSVNSLFESIRDSLVGSSTDADLLNWSTVTSFVLSGGAIVGGGAAGLSMLTVSLGGGATGVWYIIAPFLLGAAVVILITFLILAARQAIITILIIVAPLAFVAFLLPNTEKWFEKWRELFFTMLVMFPAFAVVFGGAQLAGQVIIRSATNLEQVILGLAVLVAPLAITPLLLKLGGGILNRFAGVVNNPSKGFVDRYKNYNQERLAEHRAKNERKNMQMYQDGALRRRNVMRNHARKKYSQKHWRENERKNDEERTQALWHNTTGKYGASNDMNDPSTQRQRYFGNGTKTKRGYSDQYGDKHDTELYNRRTEAHHKEHYINDARTGANAERRAMMRDATVTEGRAKLYEESINSADTRLLETQIANNANLRNIKIQADVDTAHAELQKSNVSAQGKMQFRNEALADRALVQMQEQTFEFEKRASTAEAIVQKGAEARWDTISHTDAAVKELRLREVNATDSARLAESQWNSLIENIRARGSAAPNVDARSAGMADAINQLAKDIEVENQVQTSAKLIQQENMTKLFQENETIRKYAGGVAGVRGANRVYAKAKADTLSAMFEGIKNSQSVITEYSAEELVRLMQHGKDRYGNDADEEMRMAAQYELGEKKGNNWAFQKMRDWNAQQGMIYAPTGAKNANGDDVYAYFEPERYDSGPNKGKLKLGENGRPQADMSKQIADSDVELRRDRQQFFNDMQAKSKHYIASLSGTDRGEYETGLAVYDSATATIRDIRDDKFNGERLVKTDIDEYSRMVHILSTPGEFERVMPKRKNETDAQAESRRADAKAKLLKHIRATQTDPMLYGKLEGRQRALMNVIAAQLDPSDPRSLAEKKSEYFVKQDPKDENKTIPVSYAERNEPGVKTVSVTTYIPDTYTIDKIVG